MGERLLDSLRRARADGYRIVSCSIFDAPCDSSFCRLGSGRNTLFLNPWVGEFLQYEYGLSVGKDNQ